MDRRTFLLAMLSLGASAALPRTPLGVACEGSPDAPGSRAQAVRVAAKKLIEALTPEHRSRALLAFPAHATPVGVGFEQVGFSGGPGGRGPGGGGGPNGPGSPHGPGSPGGHDGPNGPGRLYAAEQYGLARWTNFPVSIVPRPGVLMSDLSPGEREAVHGLLRETLSPMGYQKVLEIMDADQLVADGGTDYAAGLGAYAVALLGEPSAASPWMLEFGGHHLGLNVTFVSERAVLAPIHTGVLPARFTKDGRVVRALGREHDKAYAFVASLTPEQLRSATIDHDVSDLICGPGCPTPEVPPQGLKGSEMTVAQREAVFEILREWAGMLNEAQAAGRLEEIRASLPDTSFAWSGSTTHEPGENGTAYFRIHGPKVLVEFAPQRNQGGLKLHVHTVMRDLGDDYARGLMKS